LGNEGAANVVEFGLKFVKVNTVSSVQECNYELEIFM
jgi:hypothetical protein